MSLSEDGSILGVGSDRYQDAFDESQVIVYQFNPDTNLWQQLGQTLDGESSNDLIGWSVELSTDGTILASGSQGYDSEIGSDAGRVYVWEYSTATSRWEHRGKALDGASSGGAFGFQVSLSADGKTVASADFLSDDNGVDSGSVRVFEYK